MANLRLKELNLLARPATPHLEQSIDDGVQIHFALVSHDLLLPGANDSKGRKRGRGEREREGRGTTAEDWASGGFGYLALKDRWTCFLRAAKSEK